jgi:hypothetical protein
MEQFKSHLKLLHEAEQTNERNDWIEREAGLAAPPDCPSDCLLRTVVNALECGLIMNDWKAVAEGTAMLAKYLHYYPWKKATQKKNPPKHRGVGRP